MESGSVELSASRARRRRQPPRHLFYAAILYAMALAQCVMIALQIFSGTLSPANLVVALFAGFGWVWMYSVWRKDFKLSKRAYENDEPPPGGPIKLWFVLYFAVPLVVTDAAAMLSIAHV